MQRLDGEVELLSGRLGGGGAHPLFTTIAANIENRANWNRPTRQRQKADKPPPPPPPKDCDDGGVWRVSNEN